MFWAKLNDLFGVDPRSLALLRIGLALLLLLDGYVRFNEIDAMYADSGMFSISASREVLDGPYFWSLHRWNGSAEYQAALIGVAAAAAVALLMGWQTWWATLVCWTLLSSIHVRCPVTVNGGDQLLRLMLLWSLFAPLGRVWSLDAWLRRAPPSFERVASPGTAALMIQLTLVYFCTGLFKCNDDWFSGRALQIAFSLDSFLQPLGQALHNYPEFLKWLTWSTLGLELAMPLFVWSPWQTARLRLVGLAMFVFMHVFIHLTFTVGLFSLISIVAWSVFLPREFWESRPLAWLASKFPRVVPDKPQKAAALRAPSGLWRYLGVAWQAICVGMIGYSLLSNVASLFPSVAMALPPSASYLGQATSTIQRWDMFANVNRYNGWYMARARLKDGTVVDVLRGGAPFDESRPKLASTNFPNQHWRYFFQSMSQNHRQAYHQPIAEYLFRSWNERQDESRQIVLLELLFFHEDVVAHPERGEFVCAHWARVRAQETSPDGGGFDEVLNALNMGQDLVP